MKPVNFPYSNKTLVPSGKEYSDNVDGVEPLYVWTDGEQCISRWQLSFKERLRVFIFGHLWLQVLSGPTQPPVAFLTKRKMFSEN